MAQKWKFSQVPGIEKMYSKLDKDFKALGFDNFIDVATNSKGFENFALFRFREQMSHFAAASEAAVEFLFRVEISKNKKELSITSLSATLETPIINEDQKRVRTIAEKFYSVEKTLIPTKSLVKRELEELALSKIRLINNVKKVLTGDSRIDPEEQMNNDFKRRKRF